MVDLKDLRENPDKYREAARAKRITVDIDQLLEMENQRRAFDMKRQQLTSEKNSISKQIGQLAGQLKKAPADQQAKLQEDMKKLQQRPTELKGEEQHLTEQIAELE